MTTDALYPRLMSNPDVEVGSDLSLAQITAAGDPDDVTL